MNSNVEDELLQLIESGDISWQSRGPGRTIKIWKTENDWRPATAEERRALKALVAGGRVRSYPGVGLYSRGPYDLTASERSARARARA